MASIFGHSMVALSSSTLLPKADRSISLVTLGMVSACMPDIDVLGFYYGIPYEHLFGHRGITHSIVFGLLWAVMISILYTKITRRRWSWSVLAYLAFGTTSHGLIDACTSGGHGIALLVPFDNSRIFFDFRPILVSPLGVSRFMSEWGLRVLLSEAYWLGIPSIIVATLATVWRKSKA